MFPSVPCNFMRRTSHWITMHKHADKVSSTRIDDIFRYPNLSSGSVRNAYCVLSRFLSTTVGQSANQSIPASIKRSNPSTVPMKETVMTVFDRNAKQMQRDRTMLLPDVSVYDYIRKEVGYRIADRIKDVSRKFEIAVDLGCNRGFISPHIYSDMVGKLYQIEASKTLLDASAVSPEVETIKIHADEEDSLDFEQNSLDLIVSSLSLHWVNNLPGLFRKMNYCLKPDGCFIGAMFGGETLFELRCSLQLAETEREGGFAAHVSPFTSVRDLGNLLNRAGFNLLTLDVDEMDVSYPTIFELMSDLQGMGENNAAWSRKIHLHRDSLLAAASLYREMYGNKDGSIPATFEVLYMIGWKPHPSQLKPAERGSGTVSLKDIGRLDELTKNMPKPRTGVILVEETDSDDRS